MQQQISCDIAIYGATASGILAAVAAARGGFKVVLVEPSRWLGGMIGGGIRITTDCEYPRHCGGLCRELLLEERLFNCWNQDGAQRELRQMWASLVAAHGIALFFEHRLEHADVKETRIEEVVFEYAPPDAEGVPAPEGLGSEALCVCAQVWIDASYEGDLLAKAGVPYRTGREGRGEYGESLAGIRNFRTFPGVDLSSGVAGQEGGGLPFVTPDAPGVEGDASRFMIPFNFRYLRYLQKGEEGEVLPASLPTLDGHRELVTRIHQAGHLGSCRGNFNRWSLVDGSLPGLQVDYPDGNWRVRSEIWRTLMQHDRLVAEVSGVKLRTLREMYPDTGGQPHQLYIRMARRMLGDYVMTQADLALQTRVEDAIGLGYYNVDIYPCRMLVMADGTLATEGETWEQVSPGPYAIPYRALTPRKEHCSNLLVSVCVSASHVACASLRMEPTFMIMGESAGMAAAQALEEGCAVQSIGIERLQQRLRQAGQILSWDGSGYGAFWFNRPFHAWWQKHPEEYRCGPQPV